MASATSASSLEIRAGSRKPSEALVGVTSQPPSSSRNDMLPDEPGVSPRSNSERPYRQISSRRRASDMTVPPILRSCPFDQFKAEIDGLRWRISDDQLRGYL